MREPEHRPRISSRADQAIEEIAQRHSETLDHRIARQLQQQADRTHARRVQRARDLGLQRQQRDRQIANA
jgi:hypothetical protein